MKEPKNTAEGLKELQALPLKYKLMITQERIKEFYEYFDGNVYISYSGGKDSTVLKYITDSMYTDVPAVYADTGLEFPEIRLFVKDVQNGKYKEKGLNANVEIIKPEINFRKVIDKCGYPLVSKEVSNHIYMARNGSEKAKEFLNGTRMYNGMKSKYCCEKWRFLLDAPFKVSAGCCYEMKKKPLNEYQRKTGRKPIIGTMAEESRQRRQGWIRKGCNAFEGKIKRSTPMAFWTEQDVLRFIKIHDIPIVSVYGDIVTEDENGFQYDNLLTGNEKLKTTGANRTGCMFCLYGAHLDKSPNRIERLKTTHPKIYEYILRDWDAGGLGYKNVLDWFNEHSTAKIKY